jgi:DNA-binding LytR/AlgR family response regulator
MTITKKLGIWIDHSRAHLTEFITDPMTTKTIESDFTYQDRQHTIARSENVMHNKEQQRQAEYFKKVGEEIANYEEVILFGPTDAKVELFNILKADRRFSEIKIDVKQTDKMTEHQQHAFIREYFSQR